MSNLSTEVFGDMNYLYQNIANRDVQQLNENSEYYDEEFAELVEDIISTISLSMVHEGYSANAVIAFLANSPEEDIIEKYLNFDENIITESVVSEEYILEQLEIIDEGIRSVINILGKGLKAGGKALARNAKTGAKLVASNAKTATKGVGRVISSTISPGAKTAIKGAVTKVKDIAKGAKAALTSPTAKKVGLGALGLGAVGAVSGISAYTGAKMAGAGSGQGSSPTVAKPNDFIQGSSLAKLGGREGRLKGGEFRTMPWSGDSRQRYNNTPGVKPPVAVKPPSNAPSGGSAAPSGSGGGRSSSAPSGGSGSRSSVPSSRSVTPTKPSAAKTKAPDKAPAGETPMQTWARTNPKLAANVRPGQSGYQEISQRRVTPSSYEKKDQTPTTGPTPTEAQKTQAGSDVAAYQAGERDKLNKKQREVAALTQKESYDAYDIVLDHLLSYGHANTISEAEYVMTELDEGFVQSLIENYERNLLAEEVEDWVSQLLDEGYDLSEYSWDDMVDYYFSEEFKDTGYHDNYDPYSSRNGNQSIATSSRGRRIQKRVKELEKSGDNEKANSIHTIASNRQNQEHGLAKQKRNNRRGPGPRRAKEDAMRDMRNSGF
jgi:hypothetical protein